MAGVLDDDDFSADDAVLYTEALSQAEAAHRALQKDGKTLLEKAGHSLGTNRETDLRLQAGQTLCSNVNNPRDANLRVRKGSQYYWLATPECSSLSLS